MGSSNLVFFLLLATVLAVTVYTISEVRNVRQQLTREPTFPVYVFYSAYSLEEQAVRMALDARFPNKYALVRQDSDFESARLARLARTHRVWYVVTGVAFPYSSARVSKVVQTLGTRGVHVFLGSCGGMRAGQQPGDPTIVERAFQSDIGMVELTGRQFSLPFGQDGYVAAPPGITFFPAPASLTAFLQEHLPYLVPVTTASQNKFVTESSPLLEHADIVDMETVPFFYIFNLHRVHAAVIRVVSDLVGVQGQIDQLDASVWRTNLTRVSHDVFDALNVQA